MGPLTHAVVGMAICQRVLSPRLGRFGWPLALALAFASHFLLDSVPHMDAIGPLRGFRYSSLLFPVFGTIGAALTYFLFARSRDAAWIWLLLSVWLIITGFSGTVVRGLAALALIGLLAYRTRRVDAPGYLLAGILAVSPDMAPQTLTVLARFHDSMHFSVSWGTALFLKFQPPPLPSGILSRLQNPYFQTGLALEVMVEAAIFLAAFFSLRRLALEKQAVSGRAVPAREPVETRVPV